MDFPERLKELRKQNGYTQKELASELGIAYQNIQKYENGTSEPLVKNLKSLSLIFNVPISYLIDDRYFKGQFDFFNDFEKLNEHQKKETHEYIKKLLEENE